CDALAYELNHFLHPVLRRTMSLNQSNYVRPSLQNQLIHIRVGERHVNLPYACRAEKRFSKSRYCSSPARCSACCSLQKASRRSSASVSVTSAAYVAGIPSLSSTDAGLDDRTVKVWS